MIHIKLNKVAASNLPHLCLQEERTLHCFDFAARYWKGRE